MITQHFMLSLHPHVTKVQMHYLTKIYKYQGILESALFDHASFLNDAKKMNLYTNLDYACRMEGIRIHLAQIEKLILRQNKEMRLSKQEYELKAYHNMLDRIYREDDFKHWSSKKLMHLNKILFEEHIDKSGLRKPNVSENIRIFSKSLSMHAMDSSKTEAELNKVCNYFYMMCHDQGVEALHIIPQLIMYYWKILPFKNGNERICMLLMHAMLKQSGHVVGLYCSLEKYFFESDDEFIQAVEKGMNEPDYFIEYFLKTINSLYAELCYSLMMLKRKLTKPERVVCLLTERPGKYSKRDIRRIFPDISNSCVEKSLKEMLKCGQIKMNERGRFASYTTINAEKDSEQYDVKQGMRYRKECTV